MAGCDVCGASRGCRTATTPTPADIIESARLDWADRVAHAAWLSHVYQCSQDCYRAEQECTDGRRLRASRDTALERYRAHQASVGLPETPRTSAPPHTCHWPGCERAVPPKMWGCQRHWYMLPKALRSKILAAYVPGQEITETPSAEYVEVAREVQRWINDHYPALL